MNYNWEGDFIINQCVVNKKRYVHGKERKPIPTDVRAFVSPADDVVIKNILKHLVEKKGLPATRGIGDFDRRAMVIWDHVARVVQYRYDLKNLRKGDFWLFPSEVYALKQGDCEDGSFLIASLLIGSGISPFNVRVVLGELIDHRKKSLGGHSWPLYKNEVGQWCILESTFDTIPRSLQPVDRYIDTGVIDLVPHFCFNNYHLWAIYHENSRYTDVEGFLKARGDFPNLVDPKFPSGGWLGVISGDFSPGHLELTTEVMTALGFSKDAVSIASDASQDPDFYEWDTPAAHAQTGNDVRGNTVQKEREAIQKYQEWVKKNTDRMLDLAPSSPMKALFFLGYVLHGIQDLASHQGVTNAQHSYESFISPGKSKDCDHNSKNRKRAVDYSRKFLETLSADHNGALNTMKNYTCGFSLFGPKVSKKDKCILLSKEDGWDLSVAAFSEYKALAEKYKVVMNDNPRVQWPIDEIFGGVLSSVKGR